MCLVSVCTGVRVWLQQTHAVIPFCFHRSSGDCALRNLPERARETCQVEAGRVNQGAVALNNTHPRRNFSSDLESATRLRVDFFTFCPFRGGGGRERTDGRTGGGRAGERPTRVAGTAADAAAFTIAASVAVDRMRGGLWGACWPADRSAETRLRDDIRRPSVYHGHHLHRSLAQGRSRTICPPPTTTTTSSVA